MLERERKQKEEERRVPHFSNLNEDPALSGKLQHFLKPGVSVIGNGKDGTVPDVVINGMK